MKKAAIGSPFCGFAVVVIRMNVFIATLLRQLRESTRLLLLNTGDAAVASQSSSLD